MKTIGMIGGMSWESSAEYYRLTNEMVASKLGGMHSAKSVMVSVDFAEIEELQKTGKWDIATQHMVSAAQQVEAGGADFLVICTNTMHLMAEEVQSAIKIPLLHIVDPTAKAIKASGIKRVGLLGTRFTMDSDFFIGRLAAKFGLDVLVPDEHEKDQVHKIIYQELVLGTIRSESRVDYLRIIQSMVERGAEGIILGCTEIGLLVKQPDCKVPLFDTTILHATAAVDYAFQE